jgi:hypothetical protein
MDESNGRNAHDPVFLAPQSVHLIYQIALSILDVHSQEPKKMAYVRFFHCFHLSIIAIIYDLSTKLARDNL